MPSKTAPAAADDRGSGAILPPIRYQDHDTFSMRQLDEWTAQPKGTTFRRFKAGHDALVEEQDFFRLEAAAHATELEPLRAQGLIYTTSIHVVLLTRSGLQRLGLPPIPRSQPRT